MRKIRFTFFGPGTRPFLSSKYVSRLSGKEHELWFGFIGSENDNTVCMWFPETGRHPYDLYEAMDNELRITNKDLDIFTFSEALFYRFSRRVADGTYSLDDFECSFRYVELDKKASRLKVTELIPNEELHFVNFPQNMWGGPFEEIAEITKAWVNKRILHSSGG